MLKKIVKMKTVVLSCMFAIFISANTAMAEVTLPTPLGVDTVGDYVTAGITGIGAIVPTALGGWFAFKIIKRGLGWANRAMG